MARKPRLEYPGAEYHVGKVALSYVMKERSSANNSWLAEQLDMGSGVYVSKHVGLARSTDKHPAHELIQKLRKVNGKT